ncbi:MAG: hypothetical protein WCD25_30165, partial [Pseudolabrys sp.]
RARGFPGTRSNVQQKRRVRPPWGDLLGGKPIERHVWTFDKTIDRHKHSLDNVQYLQMLRLMTFYGIGGDHQYPAATGVAPAPGLPWYQLSLTLACELDPSLRIVDSPAPSKTTARWRGHDGQVLLILVDAIKEVRPKSGLRWCLKEVQKYNSGLARYSLDQLKARYYEAKRHFRGTKKAHKQRASS